MPEKKSTETEAERNRRRPVPPRKIDPIDTDEPKLPDDPVKDDDEDIFKPLDKQKP